MFRPADRFRRAFSRILTCCVGLAPAWANAYSLGEQRWGGLTVPMHLQLGADSVSLLDGATSWNSVAEDALAIWNSNLTNLQFSVVRNSTASTAENNDVNNVFFSSTVYGTAWDSRTLAITLSHYNPTTNRYKEADVLFNSTLNWNSYRGPLRVASGRTLYDFRRVALHEFGHTLGLNHPDDVRQNVVAIMNSQTSDTDTLAADDIAGGHAIYDQPGSLASLVVFDGSTGYSFLGSSLTLRAGKISNQGNLKSDNVRLELWAMPQHYGNDLPAGSFRLGAYAFGETLAPGASFSNVVATTLYTPPPGGTYFVALVLAEFTGAGTSGFTPRDHIEFSGSITATATPLPSITRQPSSQSAGLNGSVTFTGSGSGGVQWQRNGNTVSGATASSLTVSGIQPANSGVYQMLLTNSAGSSTSSFAILGLESAVKVVGEGHEIGTDIVHPVTQFSYDQVSLDGPAATITADAGQIVRMSFIDLSNDIVQVEFSGSGSLSLVLDNPSGPAGPAFYVQPGALYIKGHAGIVVTGARQNTHLSVFSVGRGNAVNQALFRDDVTYDGLADIAFIAIQSADGKFGGLRAANTSFFATKGIAGIYAPNVEFTGPVYLEDIDASDSARPMLVLGSGSDVRVTGGNLLQTNGRAVEVSGVAQLKFTAGGTSHNKSLPVQINKGRLEQNGTDVTAQLVVYPTP